MVMALQPLRDVARKFAVTSIAAIGLIGATPAVQAGSAEVAVPPTHAQWYAPDEWTLGAWGTYAFTENKYPVFFFDTADRYLAADHAWGGGIEAKRLFGRYLGIGVQAFAMSATRSGTDLEGTFGVFVGGARIRRYKDSRTIGSGLVTATFRYPIPQSRIAPYVYAGGGLIFGGGDRDEVIILGGDSDGTVVTTRQTSATTEWVGQVGGGVELRLTPYVGVTTDFSWNVVDGRDNNFGMIRSGLHLAF